MVHTLFLIDLQNLNSSIHPTTNYLQLLILTLSIDAGGGSNLLAATRKMSGEGLPLLTSGLSPQTV